MRDRSTPAVQVIDRGAAPSHFDIAIVAMVVLLTFSLLFLV
jgi:hypothetical protein